MNEGRDSMTQIFAHRGYSAKYPENTMIAFKEAALAGADGIELDVQLTKDGEIVVIHDDKVDRTTNGTGYVKDFTFKQLRKFDARHKFKTLLKKEKIPALKEVLEWLQSNELHCNIEIKSNPHNYTKIEPMLVQMIHEYHLEDRIIISSFNHYSIIYCYRIDPKIEIAPLIYETLYMPWVYADAIRAKGFHPNYKAAPMELIKEAIDQGMKVRPYTVNQIEDMKKLFEIKCTAFITDQVERAVGEQKKIGASG